MLSAAESGNDDPVDDQLIRVPMQQPESLQFSMLRERLWSIVSVICLIVAAVFVWRWHLDVAFVVATLGVLAWFLDVRHRLRPAHSEADELTEAKNVAERDEDQTADN